MSVNSLACSGPSRPGSRTRSCHATMMKPLVTVVATVGESPRASSIVQSVSPDGLARPGGGGPSPRRLETVLRGADEQGTDERLSVALELFDLGLSGRPRLERTSTRRRGLLARLVFDELVGGQSRDVPRRLLGREQWLVPTGLSENAFPLCSQEQGPSFERRSNVSPAGRFPPPDAPVRGRPRPRSFRPDCRPRSPPPSASTAPVRLGSTERFEPCLYLVDYLLAGPFGGRDQERASGGIVFRLRQEVGRDEFRSAVSSAKTRASFGPARRSMPTSPTTCRLTSVVAILSLSLQQ